MLAFAAMYALERFIADETEGDLAALYHTGTVLKAQSPQRESEPKHAHVAKRRSVRTAASVSPKYPTTRSSHAWAKARASPPRALRAEMNLIRTL